MDLDLSQLAPQPAQPAAAPATVDAVDTKPGTAQEGADATGAPEKVEETEQERAERIVQERKVREERTRRKLNARFGELTDTIKQQSRIIEQLAGRPAQAEAAKPAADGAPRREQFDDYEAYIEARAEWKAEQKTNEIARRQQENHVVQQRQVIEQLRDAQTAQTFASRLEAYAASNPEFSEVLDSDVEVGSAARAIMEMDDAPQVMVAIHRNPKIAEQLRDATPTQQGVILGRLSASLKARPPQVSRAPEPGTPVGGKPAASAKDPSRMSFDEFSKWRRETIAKRR